METPTVACSDTEKDHNYSDSGFPRMRRPRPRIVINSTADLDRYRKSQLCEDVRMSVPDPLELLRFLSFTQRPNHVGNLSKATDELSKNDSSCTRNQHNVRRDTICLSSKLTSHRHLASSLNRKLCASLSCSTGRGHSSMMRKSTLLKVKKTRQLKSRSLSFDKGILETSKDLVELAHRQEDTSLVISNTHTASVSRNPSMIKKECEAEQQTASPKSRRTGLANQQEDIEIGQKAETMAINVIDEQNSDQDIVDGDRTSIDQGKVEEKEESLLEAISKTASFKKLSCPIEIDRDSGHVSDEAATVSSQGGHQKSCRTLSLCSDITSSPIEEIELARKKDNSQTTSGSAKVSPFTHGITARLPHNGEQNQESGPPVVEKFGTKRHSSDPVGSSNALNHVTLRIGSILESTAKEQRPSSFHAYENSSTSAPTTTSNAEKLEPLPDSTKQVCTEEEDKTQSPTIPHKIKSPLAAPMSVDDLDIGDLDSDWDERRELVAKWLLETEGSYVQGLQTIIQDYMVPLQQPQTPMLIGLPVVKEIFFQIPELHLWHKNFLSQVKERVENWDPMGKIGELFVTSFSENKLMETYTKFINNFMQAKSNIQIAKEQLPMFAKFLGSASRESKDKLSLSDLLIKPVQRIPHYVLFIKDLLKQTPPSHPDRPLLSQALEEMTALAELMNESEQEARRMDHLREFVSNIEGAPNLVVPKRKLIQHDSVTELRGSVLKKDRSLFIFNDILMCASTRRKTASSFRRGSISRLTLAPSEHWTFRYKFLWQAPITAVSVITDTQKAIALQRYRSRASLDRSGARLVQDEATLMKMLEMAKSLSLPHQQLESSLQNLLADVKEQISLKKELEQCTYSPAAKVDLSVQTDQHTVTHYAFVFVNEKARNSWVEQFSESKKMAEEYNMVHGSMTSLLSHVASGPKLTFLYPMTLQLCRFGMQLKCAATGLPIDNSCSNSLWVCRSDVYGGQVCLLHIESQNKLRLMASITVCSSQIHCIAAIPQVTPKESVNAEEYFGSSYSASEMSYSMPHLPGQDSRFESTCTFVCGMDSDSEMLSSECSNSNLHADDNKKLRRSILANSSESVQTLIGISETEELAEDQRPNRTSTGTLLADDEALSEKKKTVRKRRSSLQHEPKSVPTPRRHFSLTAKIQQSEKEFSSLQDINRSTSVPSAMDQNNLKQQDAGSDSSLCTETNFSFPEASLSELSDKQVACPSPDKHLLDQQRPQSPLKKFIRMLSPTTPHRTLSSSPMVQRRVLSPNPMVQSGSRLSEYVSTKHDTVHTLRPRSVSTTTLDPVLYQQRATTLGRDHSRKQFSPMTLKPAHIKDTGQTASSQKSKMGSSQMWLGTEDKCIYVFGPGDSLRGKSKNVVHMPMAIHCIKYHCEHVYVGMENGVMAVFSTNCYGVWLFDCPTMVQLVEQENAIVSCCLPVKSMLWVACSNSIFAVDVSLNAEQIISLDDDVSVLTMEATPCGVWVALARSTTLHLYQTGNASLLATVDCSQPVHTLLTGYDSNLFKEKTANLAITNLLHSQGTLLIGTTAGVVLSLELPTTGTPFSSSLHPIALSHGHKGPVDILINVNTTVQETTSSSRKHGRRKSMHKYQSQTTTNNGLLVMSCGEGYEDYMSKTTISNIRESVGCLAVWQLLSNSNT